ncbi:MAG: CBS domain-containing protein [Chloroflexi bacterium]|nr:MAG: CBS domain-containing protein [Chloroflexota bacterium]TME44312.1 MAG: CBS domain-containing protein [Chloroflexota bacterium]
MKVREAMAKTVSSARKNERIVDIAKKMKQEDAGFIPIVEDGGKLIGVVTDRDIVIRCIASGHNPESDTVEHCMTQQTITISPEDDIDQAARKMESEEIRRLAVTENGRLVGVLSHGNVVQATGGKTAEKVTEGVTRGA